MVTNPNGWFRTLVGATVLWGAANASACADPAFGVVGSPIELSANVSEAILPGGTVFHDSSPLFGTEPDPKQSAELLHISPAGVNPSERSRVSGAFASSLAESDGNGGVGASQLVFGPQVTFRGEALCCPLSTMSEPDASRGRRLTHEV